MSMPPPVSVQWDQASTAPLSHSGTLMRSLPPEGKHGPKDGTPMPQTILVVDDDPVQRRLLEAAITRSGMNVVTAPGGQPALDMLNSPKGDQFSLMLLDLIMPDLDGMSVMTKLRVSHPDLPVIVLTAKGGIDS